MGFDLRAYHILYVFIECSQYNFFCRSSQKSVFDLHAYLAGGNKTADKIIQMMEYFENDFIRVKIHTLCDAGLDTVMTTLKLCSTEAMPSGWTAEQDKELLLVCHEKGIDNITSNVVNRPVFQKVPFLSVTNKYTFKCSLGKSM